MPNELERYEYRFGFIAYPANSTIDRGKVPAGWNQLNFNGYFLHIHPELALQKFTDNQDRSLLILGDVFVAHGSRTVEAELLSFLGGRYSSLDNLAGSFVIILDKNGHCSVLTDPIGSKPLFYEGASPVRFASHASLLAEATGRTISKATLNFIRSPEYRARTTSYLPGDLSPYDGIYQLIPNNELHASTATTKRYWPRERVSPTRFEDVALLWDEYFQNFAEFLKSRYNPVVGLTPGVDSRSTIATLRHFQVPMKFVTWEPMRAEEQQELPKIIDYLGQENHRWLRQVDSETRKDNKEFLEITARATGFLKRSSTLPLRLNRVSGVRNLFIKGLGGEILRGSASRKARPFLPENPQKLLVRTYSGPTRSLGRAPAYLPFIKRAAEDYVKRANFSGDLHGVDLGDLLYWEGRMGTYGGTGQLEIGTGMATHTAINSRLLYQASWGLPDADRLTSGLLLRLAEPFDATLVTELK